MLSSILSETLTRQASVDAAQTVFEEEREKEKDDEDESNGNVKNGMSRVQESLLKPISKSNFLHILIKLVNNFQICSLIENGRVCEHKSSHNHVEYDRVFHKTNCFQRQIFIKLSRFSIVFNQ